ncbi:MAG: FkbM family methyltransferase [Reyranella sp.]|nr:FkbM family methyltransferase [Reyranella sp.]
MSTAFAALIAGSLKLERFTFIDIGCSGGIDPAWRIFGDRLRAVAFDASVDECERLSREETHPDIKYVAGFVGLPLDHPARLQAKGRKPITQNPFFRFGAGRMLQIHQERLKTASLEEKLLHNVWHMTHLADPAAPVVVPAVLAEMGWSDVDFLKIDIDGPDFEVLTSFDGKFDALNLLAARLEVNLHGGNEDTGHIFYNTDQFMRSRGFELLGLDVRTYSMAALPSPFAITMPAQSVTGRPYQAEAFYARDPAGVDWIEFAAAMSPEKMAKLAAIFSVWNQPDSAAEILGRFRENLQGVFDVDVGLELLAGQAQTAATTAMSYKEYIAEFEAGAARFYPAPHVPWTPPTPRSRINAAIKAFGDPGSVSG